MISERIKKYTKNNPYDLRWRFDFKMACKMLDPRKNHPMIFETVIISCTVLIMCPAMSFLAALMYYPYDAGFHVFTLLANWVKLVCFNFPFAFFSQIFFIQPLVRWVFGKLFAKDIAARSAEENPDRPQDEQEAIVDIFRRMDEIQETLAHSEINILFGLQNIEKNIFSNN